MPDDRAHAAPGCSPLLPSRSLGRLIGLGALLFRVESWRPTGSWLDRSAAALVAAALAEGRTGLCAVGLDAWTLPLALRCAQVGVRLVILEPAEADRADDAARGWLSALGVRPLAVEADVRALREAVACAAAGVGLRLVLPDDPLLHAGLAAVIQEIEQAGHADALLALPAVTGGEQAWLAATALMRQRLTVVGRLPATVVSGAEVDESLVSTIGITPREADAARRLLAREEGLLVSRRGAAGLAGLVRALREDRAKRPRERRFRGVDSAVVILTGDPLRAGDGPPPEPDIVTPRPATLASLTTDLARLLVEPPGR